MTTTDQNLLADLRALIRDNYVFADRGAALADDFTADDLPSPAEDAAGFAEAATARLHLLSRDGHLRVRRPVTGATDGFADEDYRAFYAKEAITNAGGIRQVSRLERGTCRTSCRGTGPPRSSGRCRSTGGYRTTCRWRC